VCGGAAVELLGDLLDDGGIELQEGPKGKCAFKRPLDDCKFRIPVRCRRIWTEWRLSWSW
jgi:hypothetical protein